MDSWVHDSLEEDMLNFMTEDEAEEDALREAEGIVIVDSDHEAAPGLGQPALPAAPLGVPLAAIGVPGGTRRRPGLAATGVLRFPRRKAAAKTAPAAPAASASTRACPRRILKRAASLGKPAAIQCEPRL